MNFEQAFYYLLIFTVAREVVFQVTTHRMINKLMSRGFYEYQQAKSVKAQKKADNLFKVQEDLPEDLGSLAEIGL